MDVPFIAIDTNTGFHLASSNLKTTHAQIKSKAALAVLCSSILLLWRSLALSEEDAPSSSTSQTFVVETATCQSAEGSVQHFHASGNILCVVFGNCRHVLYSNFAERLTQKLLVDGPLALKDRKAYMQIALQTLSESFKELCRQERLSSCILISRSPTTRFTSIHGRAAESFAVLDSYLDPMCPPGVFAIANLICGVQKLGSAQCLIGASDVSLVKFEKIIFDNVLVAWSLSVCSDI